MYGLDLLQHDSAQLPPQQPPHLSFILLPQLGPLNNSGWGGPWPGPGIATAAAAAASATVFYPAIVMIAPLAKVTGPALA